MDLESRLISLVKKYEFLYNLESSLYKDSLKKEDTWNKIGEELNLTGDKCRRKWKCLRDCYQRSKQRVIKQSKTELPENIKIWKYHRQMEFMENVASTRIFKCNKGSSEDNMYDDSSIEIKTEDLQLDPVSYLVSTLETPPRKKQKVDNYHQSKAKENTFENRSIESNDSYDEVLSDFVDYSHTPSASTHKKLDIGSLYAKFEKFLESASSSVAAIQERSANPTILLFESMAKKVAMADITYEQKCDIEQSVCTLVFTKLAEFRSKNKQSL